MAATAVEHRREERVREADRRPQVDVEHAIGVGAAVVRQLAAAGEARVGDEDVNARYPVRQAVNVFTVGKIRDCDIHAVAELAGEVLQYILSPPMDDHRGALAM